MAQTLNFAINIDQSQIPSAIAQIQGGINNQLQAGALQLGTMASGLSATMAGLNVMGASPAQMGFAHAMAPGQVNYSLGRAPFVDRTAPMVSFMMQASDAVKSRANAIVSTMDASKIAPTISSDSRWGGVAKAVGAGILGLGGMLIGGPLGAKVGGTLGSMIGYGAGQWASNKAIEKLGWGGASMDQEKIQQLTVERKGYADIASTFMALGPRKYLPKLGEELDVSGNIAFGKSISDAFIRRQNYSMVARAAGKNPAYLAELATALYNVDPAGAAKNIRPLHRYAGASAGAAPDALVDRFAGYAQSWELAAQAAGFSSITDPRFLRMSAVARSGQLTYDVYKGPNIYQRLGEAMGTQVRLGKAFGSDFVNSLRSRIKKDLGMSSEERKWAGGDLGIAKQYAGIVLSEMATFGSGLSMSYAAQYAASQSGGKLGGNIYDVTSQAAGLLSTPKGYVDFRLNYKNIVRGSGATDALYRNNMIQQAREVMGANPNVFENEYDALRLMFMEQGMNDEAAKAQAGMILDVGRAKPTVYGGAGAKVALVGRMTPEALKSFKELYLMQNKNVSGSQFDEMAGRKIWAADVFFQGAGITDEKLALLKAYKETGVASPEIAALGKRLDSLGITNDILMAKSGANATNILSGNMLSRSKVDRYTQVHGTPMSGYLSDLEKAGADVFGKIKAKREEIKNAGIGSPERIRLMTEMTQILATTKNSRLMSEGALSVFSTFDADFGFGDISEIKKVGKNTYVHKSKDKPGEYDMDEVQGNILSDLKSVNENLAKWFDMMKKGK